MVQGIGSGYGSYGACGCPPQVNPFELAQQIVMTEMQLFAQLQLLDSFGMGQLGMPGMPGMPGVCPGGQVGPGAPAGGMDTRTACEVLKRHFDGCATGKF